MSSMENIIICSLFLSAFFHHKNTALLTSLYQKSGSNNSNPPQKRGFVYSSENVWLSIIIYNHTFFFLFFPQHLPGHRMRHHINLIFRDSSSSNVCINSFIASTGCSLEVCPRSVTIKQCSAPTTRIWSAISCAVHSFSATLYQHFSI